MRRHALAALSPRLQLADLQPISFALLASILRPRRLAPAYRHPPRPGGTSARHASPAGGAEPHKQQPRRSTAIANHVREDAARAAAGALRQPPCEKGRRQTGGAGRGAGVGADDLAKDYSGES